MKIEKAPISQVEPWEKNPRGIKQKEYERLKKQILKLGVYKPLVAYKDGEKYIVLGGNMRIRALKELGIKEVDVSIVDAPTEARKVEFALSDNDRAGYYEEDRLAELVFPLAGTIELGEFKVDLGSPVDLGQFVNRFGPDTTPAAQSTEDHEETYHFDIVFETEELCSQFLGLVSQVKTQFPDLTIGRALTELLEESLK